MHSIKELLDLLKAYCVEAWEENGLIKAIEENANSRPRLVTIAPTMQAVQGFLGF